MHWVFSADGLKFRFFFCPKSLVSLNISWAEPSDFFKNCFLLPVSPFHVNVGVALESMFVWRNQHSFLMGIPYALGFLCRWGESFGEGTERLEWYVSSQVKEIKKSVKMNFSTVQKKIVFT